MQQVEWEPYSQALADPEMIPEYCMEGYDIWRAHVPLVCHNIVEWHQPDRVLRQFGRRQFIPADAVDLDWEHSQQLTGRTEINWTVELQEYLPYWDARRDRIMDDIMDREPLRSNSAYMRWYWNHTRKWIHPDGAAIRTSFDNFRRIRDKTDDPEIKAWCTRQMSVLLYRVNPEAEGEQEEPQFRRPIQQPSGAPRRQRQRAKAWRTSRVHVGFYVSDAEEDDEEEVEEQEEEHEVEDQEEGDDGGQGADVNVPYSQVSPPSAQFIPGPSSQLDAGPSQFSADLASSHLGSLSAILAPDWQTPTPYRPDMPSPAVLHQHPFDIGSGIHRPMFDPSQMYQQPLFPSPHSHPSVYQQPHMYPHPESSQQAQTYQQPQTYQQDQMYQPPAGPSGAAARRPGPSGAAGRRTQRIPRRRGCGTGGHM